MKFNKIKNKKGNICKVSLLSKNKIKFQGVKNAVKCTTIKNSNIKTYGDENLVDIIAKTENCEIISNGSRNIIKASGTLKNVKLIIDGDDNIIFLDRVNICDSELSIGSNKSKISVKEQLEGDNKSQIRDSKILIYHSGNIEIGKESLINSAKIWNAVQVCKPVNIKIGNGCMLGENCLIETTDHHLIVNIDNSTNRELDITLKDDIWLCRDVKVKKGVVIEKNIIVGEGTTVRKSLLESNRKYGGDPVQPIGKPFKFWRK